MYATASPAATSGGSGSTMVSLGLLFHRNLISTSPELHFTLGLWHFRPITAILSPEPLHPIFSRHLSLLGLIAYQLIQSRVLSPILARLSLDGMDGGSLPRAYLAYQASYVAAKEFYSILLSWPR
jgi:hypothetical protein